MEKRTDSPYPRIDRPVLAVIGVLIVVSTVLFARNDREHEWRYYQYEFKRLVAEKFGADKAKTVPSGMQQIWVPALGHADRSSRVTRPRPGRASRTRRSRSARTPP
jgi:hypothetical protein